MRNKYRMSLKALEQRRKASRSRKAVVADWVTVKVGREIHAWVKSVFGTEQEALTALREMEGGVA